MARIEILGNIFQKKSDAGKPAIELTYTKEKNTPIAKFTIQEQRTYGRTDDNKSDFWSVSVLGKTAEFVQKNFKVGSPILVRGEIYHTSSDGKTYDNIAITEVTFVPKDFSESQGQNQGGGTQPAPQQAQGYAQQQPVQAQVQQPVQAQQQTLPPQPPQAQVQTQVAPPQPQAQPQPVPPQAPQGDPGFGTYTGFEPPQGMPPVGENGF